MLGMAGNDTYVVNGADDKVYETISTASTTDAGGIDTVRPASAICLGNFCEKLASPAPPTSMAPAMPSANTLTGNDADNVLKGMAGDDSIYGGGGERHPRWWR